MLLIVVVLRACSVSVLIQPGTTAHIHHKLRKCSIDLGTGQAFGGVLPIKIPSSKVWLGLYQAGRNQPVQRMS